jgi:hypothetical protein
LRLAVDKDELQPIASKRDLAGGGIGSALEDPSSITTTRTKS